MKQLIDTHTLLWFTMGNPRISDNLRLQIENNDNLLSIASVWEMAIKHSIGKLNLEMSFDDFVEQQIIGNGITLQQINTKHISVIAQLPLHPTFRTLGCHIVLSLDFLLIFGYKLCLVGIMYPLIH